MDASIAIFSSLLFLGLLGTVVAQNAYNSGNYILVNEANQNLISCYECNVWKAGYGQLCDNPRIRTGCYACTKFETIIFMGYYKNTPRHSVVTSRACAYSKSVPFHNECQTFTMGDGGSRHCYCTTPLCNGAQSTRSLISITTLPLLLLLMTVLLTTRRISS